MTKLRRRYPPSTPPSFYCYVTMDRREVTDTLASKSEIEILEGVIINVQNFLTRSERKSSKITTDSTVFPILGDPSGHQDMQERVMAPNMGIERLAPTSKQELSVLDSRPKSTVASFGSKMMSPPQNIYAQSLGFSSDFQAKPSFGVDSWTDIFPSQRLKIRQSLSISMIPGNHEHHCPANLRFRVQLK